MHCLYYRIFIDFHRLKIYQNLNAIIKIGNGWGILQKYVNFFLQTGIKSNTWTGPDIRQVRLTTLICIQKHTRTHTHTKLMAMRPDCKNFSAKVDQFKHQQKKRNETFGLVHKKRRQGSNCGCGWSNLIFFVCIFYTAPFILCPCVHVLENWDRSSFQ